MRYNNTVSNFLDFSGGVGHNVVVLINKQKVKKW